MLQDENLHNLLSGHRKEEPRNVFQERLRQCEGTFTSGELHLEDFMKFFGRCMDSLEWPDLTCWNEPRRNRDNVRFVTKCNARILKSSILTERHAQDITSAYHQQSTLGRDRKINVRHSTKNIQ